MTNKSEHNKTSNTQKDMDDTRRNTGVQSRKNSGFQFNGDELEQDMSDGAKSRHRQKRKQTNKSLANNKKSRKDTINEAVNKGGHKEKASR